MKREALWTALACAAVACATVTPEGAKVKVYEADLATPATERRLPEGCRVLATTSPVDQMESERHIEDPYRVQRNDTAAKGGNVLLVLSSRFITRYKTDCAPSDTSADCQNRAQNWYKVGFESYACDGAALEALAKLPAPSGGGVASWWPFGQKTPAPAAQAPAAAATPTSATAAPAAAAAPPAAPAPAAGLASSELKSKVLVLMREGVGTDVIVAYVKSNRLSSALTAEEILDWKKSGIAEPVIEAALASAAASR